MCHVIAYFHNNIQKASKKRCRNYIHNTWLCKFINFLIYSIELSHFNFYIFIKHNYKDVIIYMVTFDCQNIIFLYRY